MSEREDLQLTADQLRAQEALQKLPEEPAEPEFREGLKHRFMTGFAATAGAPAVDAAPLDVPAADSPETAVPPLEGEGGGISWRGVIRALYVPAAAAVLIMSVFAANRYPGWSLEGVSGEGTAVISGIPVSLGDEAALAEAIQSGVSIQLPEDGELQLVSKGNLVMELTPGTQAVVPQVPGRWFGRDVTSSVSAGEVRFVTGSRFAGSRLRVSTPEAAVEVVGTTFAVIRNEDATCVCVFAGEVMMGKSFEYLEVVPVGMRRFLYADGRRRTLPIGASETMKLGMLQDRSKPWLKRPGFTNPFATPAP